MNTYQCIIGFLAETPELRRETGMGGPSEALLRRVKLAASLSDAVFRWGHAPGFMRHRLACLCRDVLTLVSDPEATPELHVRAEAGVCPPWYEAIVLRVAHELVGNAAKRGARGRIEVTLRTGHGRTILTVRNDHQSGASDPTWGEELSAASMLASYGGSVRLLRQCDHTVASLELPHGAKPASWPRAGRDAMAAAHDG